MSTPTSAASPFGAGTGQRGRAQSLGVTVVRDLVAIIVTGQVAPGDLLPPEAPLSEHFGVSRTVIRESIKRLEEKGLIQAVQGRGTVVKDALEWNVLDPVVLSVLIEHDATIGVLDEFAVLRAALEGAMAAAAAEGTDEESVALLREAYARMEETADDTEAFGAADVAFHELVMSMSRNFLTENVTRRLFRGALASERFSRNQSPVVFELTLAEHKRILDAVEAHDAEAAERAMRDHITVAWQRRRPQDGSTAQ